MERPGENRSQQASYRVPAEWEPQSCIWLAWPHNRETWPGRFEKIPGFFARYVRQIAESTPVRILAAEHAAIECESAVAVGSSHSASSPNSASSLAGDVTIVDIPTDDCWIRDYGPTFVTDRRDGSLHGVNWKYNAWGGKYPPWDKDDAVARRLCGDHGLKCVDAPVCLEGGALEVDGDGRLMTTECLLSATRNRGWSREQMTRELHRYLGVVEIVWLDGGGLSGDDTDGHIDQLARFVDRENVVAAVCEDPSDPNREPLEHNYRQLRLWGDATKPSVEIHRLPIPPARYIDKKRVPESYCNFLRLGQDRMLVPTFDAPSDDHALALLRELSGCDVVGVDCCDLVWGLGALHCASRDQPAVK